MPSTDPPRELEYAAIKSEADASSKKLIVFVEEAWPIVEPATPFVEGKHLVAICQHLEAVTHGHIRNLLINIPPRHMKSLAVCVFWPVWEWISHPERRWLFASYASSLSVRDSVRCRRLIESPWFQARFCDRFALRADQNAKERFENDRGGCRIATSVGGAATGEGGDRVVVDDPHNVVEADSKTTREMALTWWDQTMSTRLNDPNTGAKIIVMQRIHEKDLSGHVLAQGGYEHLCLPAEFEPDRKYVTRIGRREWRDWRNKEGELLWPERIGQEVVSDLKLRLGPSGYAGQYQQRPAPEGGAIFRAEWFRYFRPASDETHCKLQNEKVKLQIERKEENNLSDPANNLSDALQFDFYNLHFAICNDSTVYELDGPSNSTRRVAAKDCFCFAVMDPAGTEPGDGNNPCYTVIQVWDVTAQHDMLLVYQYRAQVQTPDAADAALRIVRHFDCQYILIEKDGLGLGIVQTVKRTGISVRAIKARGSKEARCQTAEIRMSAGQIYFLQGAPFLHDLEYELLHFPRSQYCDQVDALSHAAMHVHRMGPIGAEPKNEDAPDAPADDDV